MKLVAVDEFFNKISTKRFFSNNINVSTVLKNINITRLEYRPTA